MHKLIHHKQKVALGREPWGSCTTLRFLIINRKEVLGNSVSAEHRKVCYRLVKSVC